MTARRSAMSLLMFVPCIADDGHADAEQQGERGDSGRSVGAWQADRQHRAEQQKAQQDHEACVEQICALEGKWCCQEQQRRQQQWQRRRSAICAANRLRNMREGMRPQCTPWRCRAAGCSWRTAGSVAGTCRRGRRIRWRRKARQVARPGRVRAARGPRARARRSVTRTAEICRRRGQSLCSS